MCLTNSVTAQNLISNPSFEDINEEVCCGVNATGSTLGCSYGWFGSENSPDLYHNCLLGMYSAPYNYGGYQEARTGVGYVGLVTYSQLEFPDSVYTDVREFLAQPILYTLESGEEYYIEFWVSPRDSARKICHNIGITFTTNPGQLGCVVDCPIYFENDPSNTLGDKEVWTKVSGTFVAEGWEQKIHIGNFRPDSLSDCYQSLTGGSQPLPSWDFAYYYIDDVWLSHIDSAGYVGISPPTHQRGEIKLWPNPVSNGAATLVVETDNSPNQSLTLYDATSRAILEQKLYGQRNEIDIAALPKGVYVAVLRQKGVAVGREKVVVK